MDTTLPTTAPRPQESQVGNTLDTNALRQLFDRINADFSVQLATIQESRRIRNSRVNVESLREQKKLQPDETYIAVRVIDENIVRDMPAYLSYLKQSARIAIFKPMDGSIDPRMPHLESWFTSQLCYCDPAWEIDYLQLIDGALCHGEDFAEVVYDISKPGHVAVNHVGVDRLLYDLNYDDIQQSPLVARGYRLGPIELNQYAEKGLFKLDAVQALLAMLGNTSKSVSYDESPLPSCYKIYTKFQGQVYFCWYSPTVQRFLSDPAPFYNGLTVKREVQKFSFDQQSFSMIPITETVYEKIYEQVYPFVSLRKRITEDKNKTNVAGHARDSYYLQEAATTVTSALVNGTIQASKTMWAPDESSGLEGSTTKQIDFQIARNAIWSRPMRAFSAPYPDPMLINTLQFLDTRNGVATAQTAFAVSNRKDSRKTATELSMAQQETSKINSVQVLQLSICVRDICKRAWAIMRSEVLSNNLTLPAELAPDLFLRNYTISSAGDVDYVQRMELIQSMQQDWPILSTTPVGPLLLQDYIRARYPNDADRYIAAIQQQQQDTQLIQGLASTLQELATDDAGNLTPEAQASQNELQQLQSLVQQRLSGGMGGMAAQPTNQAAPVQA